MSNEDRRKEVVQALLKTQMLVTAEILAKLQDSAFLDAAHQMVSEPQKLVEMFAPSSASQEGVAVILEHVPTGGKRSIHDVVNVFHNRYSVLEKILRQRQELQGAVSISRLLQKKDREQVSTIGLVLDKQETKNKNIIITLEDPTGTTKVIVHKNKQQLLDFAQDIQPDECIGVSGTCLGQAVFANALFLPDIPLTNELKKCPDEVYAAVISDLHIGSVLFFKKQFENFIAWTKGNWGGDEEKAMASKLQYLFIVGDAIDGIGVYPGHESELAIKDIYEQYEAFAAYLRQIPSHIKIILSPGNHDAVRIAEPQPKLDPDFAKSLYKIPNVTLVSNPAYVKIHQTERFPGFVCLVYHGFSFFHFNDKVPSLKAKGKSAGDRMDLIGKYLLQRRHLAPTYGSTQYSAETDIDDLLITTVPDLFLSGHIHKASSSVYRGVSVISGSCFQGATAYEKKLGIEPDPCVVPVISLKTRQVAMVKFI